MMIDKLRQYFNKQEFQPDILGMLINPFYFARKGLYQNISDLADKITGRTLDIGCGQKPYEKIFKSTHYLGLEIDSTNNRLSKKADYYYDGSVFPFHSDEFDSIVINEVFEHVFNPEEFLSEIHRVLKPDGILLMTVPFCWDEHEQPYDYARYSSFGLASILRKQGFKILEHRKSINDIRAIFQLLNGYIYKKIATSNSLVNLLTTIILIAPFNLVGELLSKFLPKNNDLYLDNIILAQKMEST